METHTCDSYNGIFYGFHGVLTSMQIGEAGGRVVHKIKDTLGYLDRKNRFWQVPIGFETDLASIPRIPLVWFFWGDRVHREGVLHDFTYRKDSYYYVLNALGIWVKVEEQISRKEADYMMFEAIQSANPFHKREPFWVSYPVLWGVRAGGWTAYHSLSVMSEYKLSCTYVGDIGSRVTVLT